MSQKRFPAIVTVAVLVLSLVGVLVGGYYGISWLSRIASQFDIRLVTLWCASAAVFLGAARLLAGGAVRAKRLEGEQEAQRRKAGVYSRLIHSLSLLARKPATAADLSVRDAEEFCALQREFLLVATPPVIAEFSRVRELSTDEAEATARIERFLRAIRGDLGVSNLGLAENSLANVYSSARSRNVP